MHRILPASLCLLAGLVHSALAGEIIFEKDLQYAKSGGVGLTLNLARPKESTGPLPAVVCIHGGGFRAGKKEGYDGLIQQLAQRGYVAVTVEYRLAPAHKFPAAVHDVKAAVRWLRANAAKYRINPDRIGAMGGSAGATLALMLGVTPGVKEFEGDGGHLEYSSTVTCVVDIYGATDFTQSYGKSVDAAEVLPLFIGGDLSTHRRPHILASPLYWVTPLAAPMLIIHGTQDKYVAFEQGQWIYDRLKAAQVPVEILKLEGAGHGFKGEDAKKSDEAMFAYFDKQLKK